MRLGLFFLSLFLILEAGIMAQADVAILKGHATEYANYSLVFERLVNPISDEKEELAVIEVDADGNFYHKVEIDSITFATCDLGKYRGHIYLEPGKTYDLVFPPFLPRTDADRFNPYFQPENVVLGIVNTDAQELNKEITRFDNHLAQLFDQNAQLIFAKGDTVKAKHIVAELDSLYPANQTYFKKYKQYAYGRLFSLAYHRYKRKVIADTYSGELNMLMPTFQSSFHVLFKDFFRYYFSSRYGRDFKDAYGKHASFDTLATVLEKDTLFKNKELAELVLLNGYYQGFYSGTYDENKIIHYFQQASETGSTPFIREIASGLLNKVNLLRPGTKAPDFTLYRLDGKEKSLSDYEGKFVYLNFIHTDNHTCREDLQLLDRLAKELRKDLRVVTIVVDEDPSVAEKLVKDNNYKWDFLHYALDPKVILNYNVVALPIYYLIDPEGNLRISPAPAPEENFGPAFVEALRKYQQEQWRKEKPKEKSIFDLN